MGGGRFRVWSPGFGSASALGERVQDSPVQYCLWNISLSGVHDDIANDLEGADNSEQWLFGSWRTMGEHGRKRVGLSSMEGRRGM